MRDKEMSERIVAVVIVKLQISVHFFFQLVKLIAKNKYSKRKELHVLPAMMFSS